MALGTHEMHAKATDMGAGPVPACTARPAKGQEGYLMAVLVTNGVLSEEVELQDVGGNELHVFVLRNRNVEDRGLVALS
eukprot:1158919-Pelagomonas_calceolata.AAC.10